MKAREKAIKDGFSFIQVKTVQMGQYDNYDNTNKFYISLGFKEFEIFPTLWDLSLIHISGKRREQSICVKLLMISKKRGVRKD